MSIFNLFSRKDINEGVVQYRKEDNAVLLDVRTGEEFSEGHIEGSLFNISDIRSSLRYTL